MSAEPPGSGSGSSIAGRQKRVLPSRSRRGGPGIGSCDADVLILNSQKSKRENDPLVPQFTTFNLSTDPSTVPPSDRNVASFDEELGYQADERYFHRADVIKGYKLQSIIQTPECIRLEEASVGGKFRPRGHVAEGEETLDATYIQRHRKYETFEKRQRFREKEKLKHEQYKLNERIEQLRAMDVSAFLALPAESFSEPPADVAGTSTQPDTLEGERRREEMLEAALELQERYRVLLPPDRPWGERKKHVEREREPSGEIPELEEAVDAAQEQAVIAAAKAETEKVKARLKGSTTFTPPGSIAPTSKKKRKTALAPPPQPRPPAPPPPAAARTPERPNNHIRPVTVPARPSLDVAMPALHTPVPYYVSYQSYPGTNPHAAQSPLQPSTGRTIYTPQWEAAHEANGDVKPTLQAVAGPTYFAPPRTPGTGKPPSQDASPSTDPGGPPRKRKRTDAGQTPPPQAPHPTDLRRRLTPSSEIPPITTLSDGPAPTNGDVRSPSPPPAPPTETETETESIALESASVPIPPRRSTSTPVQADQVTAKAVSHAPQKQKRKPGGPKGKPGAPPKAAPAPKFVPPPPPPWHQDEGGLRAFARREAEIKIRKTGRQATHSAFGFSATYLEGTKHEFEDLMPMEFIPESRRWATTQQEGSVEPEDDGLREGEVGSEEQRDELEEDGNEELEDVDIEGVDEKFVLEDEGRTETDDGDDALGFPQSFARSSDPELGPTSGRSHRPVNTGNLAMIYAD